jgi:hypothetical protein
MEYCQLVMEWALNHAPSSVNAATDTTIVDRFAAGQTNRHRDQHSERGQQEAIFSHGSPAVPIARMTTPMP